MHRGFEDAPRPCMAPHRLWSSHVTGGRAYERPELQHVVRRPHLHVPVPVWKGCMLWQSKSVDTRRERQRCLVAWQRNRQMQAQAACVRRRRRRSLGPLCPVARASTPPSLVPTPARRPLRRLGTAVRPCRPVRSVRSRFGSADGGECSQPPRPSEPGQPPQGKPLVTRPVAR
jgi:hypothetical protein